MQSNSQLKYTLNLKFVPLQGPSFRSKMKIPTGLRKGNYRTFKNILLKVHSHNQHKEGFRRIEIVAYRAFDFIVIKENFQDWLEQLKTNDDARFLKIMELSEDRATIQYERDQQEHSQEEGYNIHKRCCYTKVSRFVEQDRIRREPAPSELIPFIDLSSILVIQADQQVSWSLNWQEQPSNEFISNNLNKSLLEIFGDIEKELNSIDRT